MSEENKNKQDIGGLGSNDAPPSPFVNKKTGGELLEKLRTYNNTDRVAKPQIPTRRTRVKNTGKAYFPDAMSPLQSKKEVSDISESERRALVQSEKNTLLENEEEAYDISEKEESQDDSYDIRQVFGIPEAPVDEQGGESEEDEISENTEDLSFAHEFAELKNEFLGCIPKIVLTLIFLAATFFFENFELLGIKNAVFSRIYSDVRVSALAGIQITIFGVLIMLKEMRYGIKALLGFRPQPESLLPFFAFFNFVYQIVSLFAAYDGFVPFNFVLFTAFLFCLVSKWVDLIRRLYTLKIVSSKSAKYALVRMKKSESAPERKATSGIMDLSEDAKYIRVVRTKKIVGYSARTKDRMLYKSLTGVFVVASLVAAVVAFVVTGNSSFADSLRTAFCVVMFVLPFSVYTVFSYPLYKVSKKALKSETAVIGDAASVEYSAPAFVTFNDTDIFTENNVWLDEVAMKDSESFSKGLAYASAVFEPISGPLNKLFAGAADYEVTKEDIDYIDISHDGLEAVVNRERVRIGQASYFTKYGYSLEDDSNRNFRIMYVEIGNVIALKIKIVYNIDRDFEKILQNLYKSGMGVVIRTSDPNINIEMLESILGTGRFPIKVLKYKTEKEMAFIRESTNGGIVSKGKVRPMLETLYRCDRAGAVIKSGLILEFMAFIIGIIVVIFLGSLGALESLSSLYVACYHLFWAALIWVLTKIFV